MTLWRDRFGAGRFGAGRFGAHISKSISIKIILHFNVYDTIYIYINVYLNKFILNKLVMLPTLLRWHFAKFGMDHPNIWKFIDGIRVVQSLVKGRKYIAADLRIRTIVESYRERNIIEFLRGIAHNFLMEPWTVGLRKLMKGYRQYSLNA